MRRMPWAPSTKASPPAGRPAPAPRGTSPSSPSPPSRTSPPPRGGGGPAARRAELARRYAAGLSGVPGIDPPETVPYPHAHSWHLFIVKVTGVERDAFIASLAERNVGVGLHFPPCHLLAYVRERFGAREGDLPNTEPAGRRVGSPPPFPWRTD